MASSDMTPPQIQAALDRYARLGGVVPVQGFYIWGEFCIEHEGETLYSDEGLEYCEACAEALLAKALPHLPEEERDDHPVSPVDLDHEDTCQHCTVCGALLDYGLNPTGVGTELEHYESNPISGKLRPGDAYHIARMVEAAPEDPAVLRIARDAVERIQPRTTD